MKKNTFILIAAILLACLFSYAGLSKLFTYSHFRDQLSIYPFIWRYSYYIPPIVLFSELFVVELLLIRKTRLWGLIGSAALLTAFTSYLVIMYNFGGDRLPCSCGGVISLLSWKGHMVFNSAFLAISLIAIFLAVNKNKSGVERIPYRGSYSAV